MPELTFESFVATLEEEAPRSEWPRLLVALWHAGRSHWNAAHEIVQTESSREAAWIHAHLHRVEGDLPNASYWYARARRQASDLSPREEWEEITRTLLHHF